MSKELIINDFYSTSDLALSTMLSLYYPIEAIDRSNFNRASFIFKRDDGLDDLIEKFWRKELRIEPQSYFQQLKIIKNRLHNEN